MKHENNRFILSNEAFCFYDPIISNFLCFIGLLLTLENNMHSEKTELPFCLFKNQHLEKMLVFFCSINRMAPIILQERVFGGNKIAHAHIVSLIKNYLSKSIISI